MRNFLDLFEMPHWQDGRLRAGRLWHRMLPAPMFTVAAPLLIALLFAASPPIPVLLGGIIAITGGAAIAASRIQRELQQRIERAEESHRHAAELQKKTETDPVTGLANRNGFDPQLAALADTLPLGTKVGLLWLDLCRFRQINDALGHEIGDLVLQQAGERLTALAPEDAAICRYDSDEFLLAARTDSMATLQALVGTIQQDLARPFRIRGHRIESGAMIGVATMPDDATSPKTLMKAADLALYHAKSAGRSEVRFFHASMSRELARKKELEAELRMAIERDELSIFFQPIIDLRSGRIRGFEALVRWFHPEKGEIQPSEFIPVGEDSGLIITLGNWIIRQAARMASSWPEGIKLAVNLSPAQIRAPGAALGILAALHEARLDPARLELEVTESLYLEDDVQTAGFIDSLASHGVRFSLDDFGTGYSSLHYIQRHPFSAIKVDRSFVSGVNAGVRSDAIIRAVAEMGATLDMEIVAEGLETIEQVHAVRQAGCTLGQGFYFSRAVPDYTAAMLLAQEAERLKDMTGDFVHRRAG